MKSRANTLFHFTKDINTLQLILKNGFWPKYCLEDVSWFKRVSIDVEFISYPMVSFCDIPIGRISDHIDFYGSYGLGLTKEWGSINKLNPVFYWSEGTLLLKSFEDIAIGASFGKGTEVGNKAYEAVNYFLGFTKPVSGRIKIEGNCRNKEFYKESEWRFHPLHSSVPKYINLEEFNDPEKFEKANELTKKNCMLKFDLTDIRYIFVKTDNDIPEIMNFIQSDLNEWPSDKLNVLMSRVTSLQSIQMDY